MVGYRSSTLDTLCLNGGVAWGRLGSGSAEGGSPTRVTPVSLFPRGEVEELLHSVHGPEERAEQVLRGPARRLLELLESRGALFARELEVGSRLLPVQVEAGLKELIARGRVTCDGFAPLRRLLGVRVREARRHPRRGRRMIAPEGSVAAPDGRWSLLEPLGSQPPIDDRAEATARRLLRRYGVVFRDLLARESLPEGWREVHRALRRLEARGEVRGGRFVSGFQGEQFALPDAVPMLRRERSRERTGNELRVSAADPLNLVGILTPGARLPAGHTRWLVLRDGLPVAAIERGRRTELEDQKLQVTRA